MNERIKSRNPRLMKMTELCQATGLSRSTIYQYLRSGILHPPLEEGLTQLRYDETHFKQIQKIRYLRKQKKLSIPEIQKIIHVEASQKPITDNTSHDLKKLIREKALELFSQHGFAKTKITDITEELNLGKGTFYLYFKNKEELFLECIESVPDIILPKHTWEEIRQEKNYFKRTRKRIYYMLQTFPTFMGLISIAKLALRGPDPTIANKAKECLQVINRALIKDIKRAEQDGLIREIDHEFIPFVLFGMGEAAGYWRMININYSTEKCTDELMNFLSYGLMPSKARNTIEKSQDSLIVELEDIDGNKIQLRKVLFNKEASIKGKLGKGNVQVDMGKIAIIEIKKNGTDHIAMMTMKTDETATIQIDGSVMVTGDSIFGKYCIPTANIVRILVL